MSGVMLKIRRQDDPEDLPYWELFEVDVVPGMSVAAALAALAERPVTAEGNATTPVLWDCSCDAGLCGACTMLVNGKARLACQTRVDAFDGPIVLEPLSKFPVVRDLRVDRGRMFAALAHAACWTPVDGLSGAGEVPAQSEASALRFGRFQECILCGACSEACPQVNGRSAFAGAFLFSQILPLNRHPVGRGGAAARLEMLGGRGGVADCAGAENCERVCPRGIPLVAAAAELSGEVLLHSVKQFFRGAS
jgi:succinate dehydrogenase / fumarate reductase iron-sulfur subunit